MLAADKRPGAREKRVKVDDPQALPGLPPDGIARDIVFSPPSPWITLFPRHHVNSRSSTPSHHVLLTVLSLACLLTVISSDLCGTQLSSADQLFYANVKPYLEEPPEKLIAQIPELQGLRPAADQRLLSRILASAGHAVEAYFDSLIDVIAHEDIDQEVLNAQGTIKYKQHQKYDYLILLHRDELPPMLEEYRITPDGNRVEQTGLGAGFSTTSGFALNCIYLHPDFRSESTFRYLGEQVLDSRNAFVVVFAQQPGKARSLNRISIGNRSSVPVLLQGIAWIDQSNYQILSLRTDLLAPRPDLDLSTQTTEVTFAEFRLPDVPSPLWLPRKVTVSSEYKGHAYFNQHLYSDYQRFRVAVKMLPQ